MKTKKGKTKSVRKKTVKTTGDELSYLTGEKKSGPDEEEELDEVKKTAPKE